MTGLNWLKTWTKQEKFNINPSTRDFRFGDGKRKPSLGAVVLELQLPCAATNQPRPTTIKLVTDVVRGEVPLLIPKKALVSMKGKLDFVRPMLQIEHCVEIHMVNFPSGLIALPAHPPRCVKGKGRLSQMRTQCKEMCIPRMRNAASPISDAEMAKVHLHVSHCSEFTLQNMLKAGHRVLGTEQITRVLRNSTCK